MFRTGGTKKEKGCDFGYALAANSCEGVTGVEACTVTALRVDHRFRGSRPRLTPRSAVGFFGSGGCGWSPSANRSLSVLQSGYYSLAVLFCRRLKPSLWF